MNVLVDTCIWSLAFRHREKEKQNQVIIHKLMELIEESRAKVIGMIRQELLSGISNHSQFLQLRDKLRAFEDIPLTMEDYERAADMYNLCRKKGVQGSHNDFLLCSVAERNHLPIFTTDKDFIQYSKHLPLLLFHQE